MEILYELAIDLHHPHQGRMQGVMSAKPKLAKETYEDRFIRTLNQTYSHDPMCMRITSNLEFARYCGTMMRRYVDPDFTEWLASERKTRLEARRAEIVKAVDGLQSAANLYRQQEPETAALMHTKATELQEQLPRVDELLDTKRHGRFQDQGILLEAKAEMEKTLGPVTYETLANTVNAAQIAHGQSDDDGRLDAQAVRMRIKNFLDRNPNWNTTAISTAPK
jgi:hypothetical protein